MAFKVTIETKFKIPEAIKEVEGAASGMLDGAASVVATQAQRHVQPGIGPSPHGGRPHPWIDTGDLMRSIKVGDEYKEGNALVREVGNSAETPYGAYLEVGWHSRDGGFHRWPWLFPALEVSVGAIRQIIASMKL